MSTFKKYPKIHRLGKEETDGILEGECHIQEKLDGANTSIWLDKRGELTCGSRNRELTEGFNGFVDYVKDNAGINLLLHDNPTYRLYGEWLCLSGDTIIKKVSGGKGGNGNYMTLKEMYDYLHKQDSDRKASWWERYGMPLIYSLNHQTGKVVPNRIVKIEYTGIKKSYKIKTRLGFSIKSSSEHKFLTPKGYNALNELNVGDTVAVSQLVYEAPSSRRLGVGAHEFMLQHKRYVRDVGKCVKCGSTEKLELDHIDNNWMNNTESNYQVLCKSCHSYKTKEDGVTPAHSRGYSYFYDNIVSIELMGEEDMYDIEMEGGEETANFVANNFIVHNCRHTIPYNETAYKKFYLFDITEVKDGEETEEFFDIEKVNEIADKYNIPRPHYHGKFVNPTVEEIDVLVGKSELGELGEGVVIKNMKHIDKWGNHCYAKRVTEKFMEDNAVTFGGNNKHSESYWEMYVVNKYMTLARVQKVMHKIQPEVDKRLDMEHTPRVAGSAYHDMITEEAWEIAGKVGTIDFKTLKRLATKKAIQIYHDILRDSISVADYRHD